MTAIIAVVTTTPQTQSSRSSVMRNAVGLIFGILLVASCSGSDEAQVTTTNAETTTSSTTSTTAESTSSTEATTSSTTAPAGESVEVFFGVGDGSDCGRVQAFGRDGADSVDLYRATFQLLTAGPSEPEKSAGAASSFSAATADVVKSAVLTEGVLRVDFTDIRALIPNASTSCGSEALLAQLNGTAFQFPEVERTRFLIEGSCSDFANWLQRECFETDRSGQQRAIPIAEQASGSGCTPASADTLPAGRWFGFISEANAEELSFDLACWFGGTAAEAAASEDGEESPPPNDYYIRNDNDRLRTHAVDSATQVKWLPEPGNPESVVETPYATWLDEFLLRSIISGYWITVEDDSHVIAIEEQYVP
ncbi:MAG: GerMN domain-containing protein [Acidimicrobiales bacterium]|nr:GerMN domain-containing protein [Acidimicrobiales bacterium]